MRWYIVLFVNYLIRLSIVLDVLSYCINQHIIQENKLLS